MKNRKRKRRKGKKKGKRRRRGSQIFAEEKYTRVFFGVQNTFVGIFLQKK